MAIESSVVSAPLLSGADLAELVGIEPCELVEGRIVPMSPTGYEHGLIENALGAELRAFAQAHKLGKVLVGEVGIYTHCNPDTIRAADVLFISNARYTQRQSKSYLDVAPELVVEIMSPGDAWADAMRKLREYFAIGVLLVWVVDPAARVVYANRSMTDIREFASGSELPGDAILPGFSVAVAQLFEE